MARIAGVAVTSVSTAEIEVLDTVTAGTVVASKALVVDSNKDLSALRNLVLTNLDAGASGTAGTVDVFPTTASKGKLAISVTDQTGNTTASVVMGAQAAARTLTIPDPSVSAARFRLTDMPNTAVTATADGLTTGIIPDTATFVTVTSANADHIVALPTPTPGHVVQIKNGATGYELRSSAPETVSINGGAEAAAESAIGANVLVTCTCVSATAWIAMSQGTDGAVTATQVAAAA